MRKTLTNWKQNTLIRAILIFIACLCLLLIAQDFLATARANGSLYIEEVTYLGQVENTNKSVELKVKFSEPMAWTFMKNIRVTRSGGHNNGQIDSGSQTRLDPTDTTNCTIIFNINNFWGNYEYYEQAISKTTLAAGDYTLLLDDYNLKTATGTWAQLTVPFSVGTSSTALASLDIPAYHVTTTGSSYSLSVPSYVNTIGLLTVLEDPLATITCEKEQLYNDDLLELWYGDRTYNFFITSGNRCVTSQFSVNVIRQAPRVIKTEVTQFENNRWLTVLVTFNEPVSLNTESSRIQFYTEITPGQTDPNSDIPNSSNANWIEHAAQGLSSSYLDENDRSVVKVTCDFYDKLNPTANYIYIGFSAWADRSTKTLSNNTIVSGMYKVLLRNPNPANNNTALDSLSITGITLTPVIQPNGTIFYEATVPDSMAAVEILATPEDEYAQVSGLGTKMLSSSQNEFTVSVLASNKTTTASHTIIINKSALYGKTAVINAVKGQPEYFIIPVENVSSFAGKTYKVTYDPAMLQLTDAASITVAKDLNLGPVPGSNITIVKNKPGELHFTVNQNIPSGQTWSGAVNVLTFVGRQHAVALISLSN